MPPLKLLWVNKDAKSSSLSHSEDLERIEVLSHAQRTSRPVRRQQYAKATGPRLRSNGSKGTRASGPSNRPRANTSQLDAPPCSRPAWSPREQRSIDFFLQMTVRKIIFRDRDRTFWTQTVPCLAAHNAAFRHLVVAIASTHELLQHTDAASLDVFALTQCNKATQLLQAATGWQPALLLASCILVVAFSLLRCDYAQADMGIENGLKLPLSAMHSRASHDDTLNHRQILQRLSRAHGFKLWTPDISSQFGKSTSRTSFLDIETDFVRGPFLDVTAMLRAYKDVMMNLVAKIMRNLTRGAYVDPQSLLAQDAIRQLAMLTYYWDVMYNQLSEDCLQQRLELKQLRFGVNNAYLVFFTKVVATRERTFDAYPNICNHSLELAEELLSAIRTGLPVVYMDRIVNGALFSLGMCSRDPVHRKRVTAILQGQMKSHDGLDHWLRGTVIELIAQAEDVVLGERNAEGLLPRQRMILSDMSCEGDVVRLDYAMVTKDSETLGWAERAVDWEPCFGSEVTSKTVNDSLQGIMAAYRLYGKPRPSEAPLGYLREMRYKERLVSVCWEQEWMQTRSR